MEKLGVWILVTLALVMPSDASEYGSPETMPTRVVLGQVSSERQQAVQFEISGTQLSRRIDTGTSVQVGDLLVQLDDREARARKTQFEANHANLKAQQNHRKGVIADAELEAQQLRFDQLGSELLHARAEITIADIYIEKHRLRAPFNGVLLGCTTGVHDSNWREGRSRRHCCGPYGCPALKCQNTPRSQGDHSLARSY